MLGRIHSLMKQSRHKDNAVSEVVKGKMMFDQIATASWKPVITWFSEHWIVL